METREWKTIKEYQDILFEFYNGIIQYFWIYLNKNIIYCLFNTFITAFHYSTSTSL